MQIIYLNGPSSSGKTTLAKALQNALPEPFLHVGIDKIIGWMPEKLNAWMGGEAPEGFSWKKSEDPSGHPIQELQLGPFAQKIGSTFREVVLTLAKMGHFLIIDDVSFGKLQIDEWKEALKNFRVLWIGVNSPLNVLEQRERERGNRMIGSARAQFHKVHVDAVYDLEIDTHTANLSENVSKIQALMTSVQGELPHQNISRLGVYGVVQEGHNILVVVQEKGPYLNRFDLPGGGIEFGETVEQTLHREFLEEVGMDFESMQLMTNLTTQVEMPSYTFHQIGLIYSVRGLRVEKNDETSQLKYSWVDMRTLTQDAVSPFLWAIIHTNFIKRG